MHKASSIGYGSSSQLYEKAPKQVGMTPNIYQQDGKTISIIYAIAPCPLDISENYQSLAVTSL